MTKSRVLHSIKKVDKEYGVGSDFWRNGTALTGLLAGALGGNVTGGMAAGAAPYVAGLIKSVTDGHKSARIALHTLASAVLVQLQGGNAAVGAAGGFIAASSSEALSLAFYNKEPDKLSPDEKTVIVNLVAALGAAGGSVAAGNSSGIGGGANAARVEVENNTFLISLHPDAYQNEFKKSGDPLYRLTDKYEQEVREHAEAGDPVAIQELHNLEEAKENAKAAIALYGVLAGGSTALAATPELIALVRATASSCAGNPVLCANEVSIWIAEMAVGDALPAGLTAATVSKMSVAELSELKALMAVEKQTGQKVSAESLETVMFNSGGKGNWTKELNNPQPNKIYPVDGNKIFKTDELGRTSSVEANLSLITNDRNTYQQCKTGKCGLDSDEGGHLIASIFNGPGEKINIVPMDANLNKGEWKKMENYWANELKSGNSVNVKINPVYIGESQRPVSFDVVYSINNDRPVVKNINNMPGGVK